MAYPFVRFNSVPKNKQHRHRIRETLGQRFRRLFSRRIDPASSRRNYQFEALEPRLLLSADPLGSAAQILHQGLDQVDDWARQLETLNLSSEALAELNPSLGQVADIDGTLARRLIDPLSGYLESRAEQATIDGALLVLGQTLDEIRDLSTADSWQLGITLTDKQHWQQGDMASSSQVSLAFNLGVDRTPAGIAGDAFFIQVNEMILQVGGDGAGADAAITPAVQSFTLQFNDPDTDGRLTLSELQNTPLPELVTVVATDGTGVAQETVLDSGAVETTLVQATIDAEPVLDEWIVEQPGAVAAHDSEQAGLQLVFVDPAVQDYERLYASIIADDHYGDTSGAGNLLLVVLDAERDGIEQITEALAGYTNVAGIHILSHGSSGGLQLGSTFLTSDNLDDYEQQLGSWRTALDGEADILLYGCNVASGEWGVEFTHDLSALTGADVAASDDLTGNAILGGDWDLEYTVGNIETMPLLRAATTTDYQYVLATVTTGLTDAGSASFTGSAGSDSLWLRLNDSGVLEFSEDGETFLSDLDTVTALDQELVLSADSLITVDLGDADDTLYIDTLLSEALSSFEATLAFFGGAGGGDTLMGPALDSIWEINAGNAGTLNTWIGFSGVENLTGAADNEDTFVLKPGGSLGGVLDGGTGGFDSLVIEGDSYDTVAFTATGPQSGSVNLDGNNITYAGLEPIDLLFLNPFGTVANVIVDANPLLGDDLVLENHTGTGTMQVRSLNGTMESVSFANPTESLTINLGDGVFGVLGTADDILSLLSFDAAFDAALIINGGDGADQVFVSQDIILPGTDIDIKADSANLTVNDGVTLSTRTIGGSTDYANAVSTGDSGNIRLEAEVIIVGSGAMLLAHDDRITGQTAQATSVGDITLLAKSTGIKELEDLGPLNFQEKVATIDIGTGAQISGTNLIIRAEAADKSFTSLLGTSELFNEFVIDPLINDISGLLDLPFKVLFKESDARVTVNDNVVLTGTAGVTIEADSIADASQGGAADTATASRFPVKATSKLFSIGYVEATSTAIVDIKNGVIIDAGDAVVINADGTAVALLKTETSRELGDFPGDPLKASLSLAITKTDITSQALVAEGVIITAGKTVNITAEGLEDSEAEAESGLYTDGRAGLAFGLSFSDADINAVVNGTVIAHMDAGSVVKLEFDPTETDPGKVGFVDTTANTITVGEHALATGDKIEYSNRRGTSIGPVVGGLTDGDVFFVITTDDPTRIQLAETRDKAIAGDEISLAGGADVNSKSFTATSAVDSSKNTITLDNPALTGSGTDFSLLGSTFELGQAVRYNANGSAPIEGLVDGKTYYVITGTNEFNLQGDLRFVDKQVIQLAETENESRAGVAINLDATGVTGDHTLTALHVLDSGLATGIGVLASLDSTTKGIASSGIADKAQETEVVVFDFQPKPLFDKLTESYGDNADKPGSGASPGLQIAGALGFVQANHTVTADVGANAVLKSNEDLEVKAGISEALQTNAESSVETVKGEEAADATISAAVIVGLVDNTAQATVASGADLDALRAMRVISDVSYPYLTRPDEFIPANLGELSDLLKSDGLDAVNDYADGTLGLKSKLFNTWARSSGEAGGIALAGSLNYLDIDNVSEAIVRSGVQINQDLDWRDNTQNPHVNNTDQQVVSVEATNYMQMLNVTGVFDFKFPSGTLDPLSVKYDPKLDVSPVATEGGKGGVGGAIFISLLDNTTTALVESDVALYSGSSGSFNMKAEEAIMNLNFSQAGAEAGQYAIAGTVAYVEQDSRTQARLESGAIITGGVDPNETDVAGSPVTIYAGSLETGINWAGSIAKGENLGFGITVAINDLDRDTSAIIGAIDPVVGTTPGTTDINASGALNVNARVTGNLWAFSLAAAVRAEDAPDGDVKDTATDTAGATAATDSKGAGSNDKGNQGEYGLGISGDVSLNRINDNTRAFINDAGTFRADRIALMASNDTEVLAVAGAVFVSSEAKSIGLAGSWSEITLTGATEAWINAATLLQVNGLSITANRTGDIFSITAGGSGAPAKGSVTVAGSVSINRIANTTTASLDAVSGTVSGDVALTATDHSDLFAIAGAVSFGGKAGVGAAVGINKISNTTTASISGSTFTQTGELALAATSDATIEAITASAGVSQENLGAAGTVSINEISNTIAAFIIAMQRPVGAPLTSSAVSLSARDETTIRSIAGAIGVAKNVGFGAAVAYNDVENTVSAYLDDSVLTTTGSLGIEADSAGLIETIAAGVAGGKDAGLAGSVTLNSIANTVDAHIGDGAIIEAGDISLSSNDVAQINSLAGALAGASTAAVAAAVAVNEIGSSVTAYIGGGVSDTVASATNGDVSIHAMSAATLNSISAGGGGAGTFALLGSFSFNTVATTIDSYIGDHAVVTGAGNVMVAASDQAEIFSIAGNVSGAGTASVGVANSTTITDNSVTAYIGDADVTALGNAGTVTVFTGHDDNSGDPETLAIQGLVVSAVSAEDIETFAVAGTGAGSAGIAGTATVSVLEETTQAFIGAGASINADNSSASVQQDVHVYAADGTTLLGVAGVLAGGGAAGVGASADVGVITKDTRAYISADLVNAAQNVRVIAVAQEDITSVGATFAGGGSVGVGGAAGVYTVNNATRAFIGNDPLITAASSNAVVTAGGSVLVAADNRTEIDIIAGNLAVSGAGSLGGAAGVTVINKTTEAFIGSGATVDARAGQATDAVRASTGNFTTSYVANSGDSNEVSAPESGGADADDESLTMQRVATADTTLVRGVAVTATNSDDIETIGVSAGGSGGVDIQLSAAVDVTTSKTTAYVADGAMINQNNGAAGADQAVLVAAGNDYYRMGVAGAGSISGGGSATPGADIAVIRNDTEAYIGAGAVVDALGDVQVLAGSTIDILSISAALAGSGGFGVAGAVSVIDIGNKTHAYVDGQVTAGGNMLVAAVDNTEVDIIAGSLGLGLGVGGLGASVGVTVIDKDTRAYIGDNATVDVDGAPGGLAGVVSGAAFDSNTGSFPVETGFQGLAVQAQSSEDIFIVAAAGSGGAGVGVAGAVSVEIIDSDTRAYIATGALVNQNTPGAGNDQAVNVSAVNSVQMLVIDGSIGGSAGAGIAGGVDVGIVRNDTAAYIAAGATVNANQDVNVNALSMKEVDSYVVSASGGALGIAGAVVVYALGGDLESSYSSDQGSEDTLKNDDPNDSLIGFVDSQLLPNQLTGMLGSYGDIGFDSSAASVSETGDSITFADDHGFRNGDEVAYSSGGETGIDGLTDDTRSGNYFVIVVDATTIQLAASAEDATAETPAAIDIAPVTAGGTHTLKRISGTTTAMNETGATVGGASSGDTVSTAATATVTDSSTENAITIPRGTTAFIDGVVNAGVNVDLDARSTLDLNVVAGGVSGGGIGIGASVGVITVDANVDAHIGSTAVLRAGTRVDSGDVLVDARFENNTQVVAFAGGVGGTVGLGAAVVVVNDTSDNAAYIADGSSDSSSAQISRADAVNLTADTDIDLAITTLQGSFAGGIAAGAAVARAEVSGATTASAGEHTQIGQTAGETVGSLGVIADSAISAGSPSLFGTMAVGIGAGVAAGAGGDADAIITATTDASIGSDADITVTDAILVRALSVGTADADADGGAGGALAVGAMLADAVIGGATRAHVNDAASMTAGNVQIEADATTTATANTVAASGGLLAGTLNLASADISRTVEATIGAGAGITATAGAIIIDAGSTATANADTLGVVGGAVGIGISLSEAEIDGHVEARIDGSTTLGASSDIIVRSRHNMTAAGVALTDGTGATASAVASGGGALAGTGAQAEARSTTDVQTFVNSAAGLDAGNNIIIEALGNNAASATGGAISGGLAGVGGVVADAVIEGTTEARVFGDAGGSEVDRLDAGNDIFVRAIDRSYGKATANASAGGVAAGAGADADSNVTRTVRATIGNDASTAVDAGKDVRVEASGDIRSRAIATGNAAGALAVGVSLADAITDATVEASIGAAALVNTGGGIFVAADLLPGTDSHSAYAEATSSSGSLIGGSGAATKASATGDVTASVGDNAVLTTASGDIDVTADAVNSVYASTVGDSVGLITGGRTDADGYIVTTSSAIIGHGAVLTAADNMQIASTADSRAEVESRGGIGGVAGGGTSDVLVAMTSNALTTINDNATLTATNNITLAADNRFFVRAEAYMVADGVLANVTNANTVVQLSGNASVVLGENVTVTADSVDINVINRFDVFGYSESFTDTTLAGAFSNADTDVDVTAVKATISVGAGTVITGNSSLSLTAFNLEEGERPESEGGNLESRAKSGADTGILATATADANGTVDTDAVITTAALSVLTTNSLTMQADSLVSLNRAPDAVAEGFITKTTRVVKEVVRKVTKWLPWPLNKIVEWVVDTVVSFVTVFEFATANAKTEGTNDSPDDVIRLDGDIYLGSEASKTLIVNADGTIHPDSNVGATIDSNNVLVDDIINESSGSASFRADNGIVSGNATINVPKVLASVRVENYSDRDLLIQKIALVSDNQGDPDVSIIDKDSRVGVDDTPFDIVNAGGEGSRISIINHSTDPDADVIFTEKLDDQNVVAIHYIQADGGDILQQDAGDTIRVGDVGGMINAVATPLAFGSTGDALLDAYNTTFANRLNAVIGETVTLFLFAENGQIGSSAQPFTVEMLRGKDFPDGTLETTPVALRAVAYDDIFLTVSAENSRFTDIDPALNADLVQVDLTSTHGNINLTGTAGLLLQPVTNTVVADVVLTGTPILSFSDGVNTLSGNPLLTFADNILSAQGNPVLAFDSTVAMTGTSSLTFSGLITQSGTPNLDFLENGSIVRDDGGNWFSDGFVQGQTITVSGSAANDGTYEIATVGSSTLTLTSAAMLTAESGVAGVTVATARANARISRDSGSWIEEGFQAGQTITVSNAGTNNGSYTIESLSGDVLVLVAGDTVSEASGVAAAAVDADRLQPIITRDTGNWLDDGFRAGQTITITNAGVNDGTYTLAVVDASVLTLQAGSSVIDATAVSGSTVTADRGLHTITRAAGSWFDDGFGFGQTITITGTGANNGTFTIASLTSDTITLAGGESVVDEITAGVTLVSPQGDMSIGRDDGSWITDGFALGQTITVSGTSANDGQYLIGDITHSLLTLVPGAGLSDETINLAGTAVTITADAEQVVSEGVTLQATTTDAVYDILRATASLGNVMIDVTGDLNVGDVSAAGVASLTASRDIIDRDHDSATDVAAASIDLTAAGDIGSTVNPFDINLSNASDAALTVSATGDVTIVETSGNLVLDSVSSTAGVVRLTATSGAIVDDDADSTTDIVAGGAILIASESLGSDANPLETMLANLEGSAGNGGIWIDNTGALIIGGISDTVGLTAAGPIMVTTFSPLTVTEDITSGDDITLTATDSGADNDDVVIADGADITSSGGEVTILAGDNVRIDAGTVITATGPVTILADQGDADAGGGVVEINGIILASAAVILGGDDDDIITIDNIVTPTTVLAGGGNDTIYIGSNATASSNTGGNVNGIGALLVVDGGAGTDVLDVDDSVDIAGNTGTLTGTMLTGLGMTNGGIQYEDIESLAVKLGSGNDTFNIQGTHTWTTTVNAGAGEDTINVQSVSGNTTVNAGADNDVVNVGSTAPTPGGVLDGIGALLSINGDGGTDTVNLDDSADTADNLGTLTGFTLSGLGMGGTINYAGIDILNLDLGSGDDRINVHGTSATTNLDTAQGDDLIYVSSGADLGALDSVPANGDLEALHDVILHGTLDGVTGTLNIEAGAGQNTLGVSDRTDADADANVVLTATSIQGLAAVDINYLATGGDFSGQGVWARGADRGLFGRGINIYAGAGGNTINIQGTASAGALATPFGKTVTGIYSGAGADQVSVAATLVDDGGRFAVIYGEAGTDTIDAALSGMPLTIFGGNDDDTLTGSASADFIFGDAGRDTLLGGDGGDYLLGDEGAVYYRVPEGTNAAFDIILNSLGSNTTAGPDGDSLFLTPDLVTSIAAAGDANDAIFGGDDADRIIGGGNDDVSGDPNRETLDGEAGADIVFGDHAQAVLVNGLLTQVVSIDHLQGGADTMTGGSDNDVLLGGYAGDSITDTSGHNIVLGDDGRVVYDLDTDLGDIDLLESLATTAGGGVDVITTGAGNDIVIGGRLGDSIDAGEGSNLVIGDSGRITAMDTGSAQFAGQSLVFGTAETIETDDGGDDTITTGTGNDLVLGGAGGDTVNAGAGNDIALGDNGRLVYAADGDAATLDRVETTAPGDGGADTIYGGAGNDLVAGGADSDLLYGGIGVAGGTVAGTDFDIILGDNGAFVAIESLVTQRLQSIETTDTSADTGGNDRIEGNEDDDIILGGVGADMIDGNAGDDLVLGDNGRLDSRDAGKDSSPRYRVLTGSALYGDGLNGGPDGEALVDLASQYSRPGGAERWANFELTLDAGQNVPHAGDTLAGGAGDDTLFGQGGNDVIQGDGSITTAVSDVRNADGTLANPSTGQASDGDDYIEGNAGNDLIFGNLGQDDLIGGSSSLFGLDGAADGADVIFGGAGSDTTRNTVGDETVTGHASDSDMILGDNGNIFRLVGTHGLDGGTFLSFSYDNYSAAEHIIVRAAELLDYTPGGSDYDPLNAGTDQGAGDELHGEAGDDFIYGMVGNDVLFGEGQDDDLIGGYGHDAIFGGTGADGVLGDDGRIYTSRNSTTTGESLYGIAPLAAVDVVITTPGKIQQATTNIDGALKKTVNLTPFNVDPDGDILFDATQGDDIIYGGFGDDFLHGGVGDDAISGAEALAQYYTNTTNTGNVLRYGEERAGEFAAYDEFHPLRKILVDGNGVFTEDGTGDEFLLNFDAADTDAPMVGVGPDGVTPVYSDGNDVIFGDLGNDWLVGGTGQDHLFGGWGDDLLNADDDHDSTVGSGDDRANNTPDGPVVSYEDIAYGGAGRDVLIANTGGDRLIDWVGEFNSYLVPFAPFGPFTISRAPQPQIAEYLYALGASDGADPTVFADTGSGQDRNGEPYAELGVVIQKDFEWQDQTGAPDDIQPGNIPGGPRDVIRSATFNTGTSEAFAADSGDWSLQQGRLEVAPEVLGADAVSVFHVDAYLPSYYELQATINAGKPMAGFKSNAYLIFDYQSPTDFKYAGINISNDKLEIGYRDASGWHEVVQNNARLKPDTDYNVLLSVNGTTATLVVNNRDVLSYAFAPRTDADGFTYGLNAGMVGIGANNSKGRIDNVKVQVLPPEITFAATEDFNGVNSELLSGERLGTWVFDAGRFLGSPAAPGEPAVSLTGLSLAPASVLELETVVNTSGTGGLVFDYYDAEHFKFVALNTATGEVVIGHHTAHGWAIDVAVDRGLEAGTDHTLELKLVGSSVNVILDGQMVLGHVYNSLVVDGDTGLMVQTGDSSFDDFSFRTNDPAFLTEANGEALLAASAADAGPVDELGSEALQPLMGAAVQRWSDLLSGADPIMLEGVNVRITDLSGDLLGLTVGDTIYIDSDAAGHGWFVDETPLDDAEFSNGTATSDSLAYERMDLLSVLMHEYAHVLGLDADSQLGETLDAGSRIVPVNLGMFDDLPEGSNDIRIPLPVEHAAAARTGQVRAAAGNGALLWDDCQSEFTKRPEYGNKSRGMLVYDELSGHWETPDSDARAGAAHGVMGRLIEWHDKIRGMVR